jgi:hypothetical protein
LRRLIVETSRQILRRADYPSYPRLPAFTTSFAVAHAEAEPSPDNAIRTLDRVLGKG